MPRPHGPAHTIRATRPVPLEGDPSASVTAAEPRGSRRLTSLFASQTVSTRGKGGLMKMGRTALRLPRDREPESAADYPAAPLGNARATALAGIAQDLHRSLVRFLTKRTGSREDANDIAQEAYLRVLTVQRTEAIDALPSYVWRSALNLVADQGRRTSTQVRYAHKVCANLQVVPSAEAEACAEEQLQMIADAIAELPPRCRHAFSLRVLRGLPFDDVGREMKISARMAKIYVARTLAYIQHRLDTATAPEESR